MTNKPRKPQVPSGTKTILVRTETSWPDSSYPSSILRGDRPAYDRLPTQRAPEPPATPAVKPESL